ncbi:TetR/AcrR family transcriptional regulator [Catenuloplanes atrovinosus]|uniref:AcrR family transcriptional regulator n=1 Tax=Catenuloplanes atrovinosus TaxID=137266 RepID=A0AAE3YYA5_9ACTN|nr:TetR family transcriptional regulator [Catenuloplanes atrovinosus]MDR7280251.1 AcrR family transcriptional regulator [Catenuloplanes atrovinosus]
MGRWEPGADSRLREAAIELFLERGFEQTMVADIAERAGVTARTFFRHFADKREVIFQGAADLEEWSLAALEKAPATASALETVEVALDATARLLGGDHGFARKRQAIIESSAELRERELIKLNSLSARLEEALRRRGFGDLDASLAAATGIAVYRVAFERWAGAAEDGDLREVIRDTMIHLRALTAAE